MYTHDYWCIPTFVGVYPWLLMYTYDCLQGCRPGVSAIDRRHGCRVVDNDLDDDDADFVSRKYFLSHEGRLVGCLWVGFVLYIKDPVKLCLVNFEDT